MMLSEYDDEDLFIELKRRGFKVAIKIIGVDVICTCKIKDKEFEMRAI